VFQSTSLAAFAPNVSGRLSDRKIGADAEAGTLALVGFARSVSVSERSSVAEGAVFFELSLTRGDDGWGACRPWSVVAEAFTRAFFSSEGSSVADRATSSVLLLLLPRRDDSEAC
jgi:hypothetical protein